MWYVVSGRRNYGRQRPDGDPQDAIWTVSESEGQPGRETDGGFPGCGLTKAQAEWLAQCANDAEWARDWRPTPLNVPRGD